jgi:RNA polymerase sigma-70 factor (ECF subfamily)
VEFFTFDSAYLDGLTARDPEIERHFLDYFGELLRIKLRARRYSYHTIDDICQETFLRVMQTIRREGIRDPQRIGSFVNSVCNHVMQEDARAANRYATPEEGMPDMADPRADAERSAADRERHSLVQSVLQEMSPKNRDLITAVFLDERQPEEVCRQMGVDANYLRVLLFRARTQFREILKRRNVGKRT